MADRSFIIEVLLKARDDTARAFASAMGEMDAYDAKLAEQRVKTDALTDSNGKLSTSYKKLVEDQGKVSQGHRRIISSQASYQRAAEAAAKAETNYRKDDLVSVKNAVQARKSLLDAQKKLTAEVEKAAAEDKKFNIGQARDAAEKFRAESRNNALLQERTRILGELEQKTHQLSQASDVRQIDRLSKSVADLRRQMENLGVDSEQIGRAFDAAFDVARTEQMRLAQERTNSSVEKYRRLIDSVAQAERRRDSALSKQGLTDDQRGALKERLDIDVETARGRLEEFRLAQRAKGIDVPVRVNESDIQKARLAIDALDSKSISGGGSGAGGLDRLKKLFADLDTSTSGFNTKFKGALGFSAVALVQPLLTMLIGLVGVMGALGSAAFAAGGALGGLFVSMGAQGVPAIGLFAGAMTRLASIFSYVSLAHQQLQQRFTAGYQNARLNRLGINQVTTAQHNYQQALIAVQQAQFGVTQAEHSYRDSLFSQQQAVRNVGIATFQLKETRQQAARQLQDLILQEEAARLAAEGSSLAVTDAQKALRASIATGGDVQAAQLGLQQAQLSHVQSTVQAQRSIQDAAQGSLARQGIVQQVTQAENAVTQARRAVVDANFAVQAAANSVQSAQQTVANAEFSANQSRAAIELARQQAAGYNVAAAAQLAFLRSQMTTTEKALAGNVQRIFGMFTGVSGKLRPFTDAILKPFIGITSRLLQIFNNRQFMSAFQNLANQMGNAIGRIGRALLNPTMIKQFITIVNAAAANMKPLANIAIAFFKSVGAIAQAAAPFIHIFLKDMAAAASQFASWADSAKGQNWLKQFFDIGFKSLEAFIRLGASFLKLFAAIAGAGGGAKQGISLLQGMTDWANRTTKSINAHGSAWKSLQTIWSTIGPTLSALGAILGAIGHGMMQLITTGVLKNIGDIIANTIVPGLVMAFKMLNFFTSKILGLIHAHPILGTILKDIIAFGVFFSIASKAVGLVFGPLAAVVGLISKMSGLIKRMPGLWTAAEGGARRLAGILGKFTGLDWLKNIGKGGVGGGGTGEPRVPIRGQDVKIIFPLEGAAVRVFVVNPGFMGGRGSKERPPGEHIPPGEKAALEGGAAATAAKAAAAEKAAADATKSGNRLTRAATTAGDALKGAPVIGKAITGFSHVAKYLGPAGLAIAGLIPLLTGSGGLRDKIAGMGKALDPTAWVQGFASIFSGLPVVGGLARIIAGIPSLTGLAAHAHTITDAPYQTPYAQANVRLATNAPSYGRTSSGRPGGPVGSLGGLSGSTSIDNANRFTAVMIHLRQLGNQAAAAFHNVSVAARQSGDVRFAFADQVASELVKAKGATNNVVTEMLNHLAKLPKGARTDAANMAIGIASELEARHQLPVGTADKLRQAITGKFTRMRVDSVSEAHSLVEQMSGSLGTLAGQGGILTVLSQAIRNIGKAFTSVSFGNVSRVGANFLKGIQQGVGMAFGGPIPGYGGGDTHPRMLEGGEHVFTKEEVSAAGGHGAIYALRSALGGGGQGGPVGYVTGGAVSAVTGGVRSIDFQGVHGTLGGDLQNIQNFAKQFRIDWQSMWDKINKQSATSINDQEKLWKELQKTLSDSWRAINSNAATQSNTLYTNIADTLNKLDNAIMNAFQYVSQATNSSLKAFGSKPVDISLGSPPKFSGGGPVGNFGERGEDHVVARVGRGEAILNWAHQKFVDPALRKMYGFGLPEMFDKVRGAHAGAKGYMDGLAGYASGGYVYPFGPGLTLGRTDMGLDMGGSGYIAAIGDATFTRVTAQGSDTGWPGASGASTGALMVYRLNSGPARGRYVYLAENVDPVSGMRAGKTVPAGTAIAHARGFYPYLETGWARDSTGTTLAAYHASQYPNHSNTPEGIAFTQFINGLSHGKLTGLGAAFGGKASLGAVWKKVKEIAVKGTGPLADLARAAIQKVTGAANKYGEKQAGSSGGTSGFGLGAITNASLQALNHAYAPNGGVRFSPTLVAKIAQWAGLPGITFSQIAEGESNYEPGALEPIESIGIGGVPVRGYGLWQITTGVGNDALINKYGGTSKMFNPLINAKIAKAMYDSAGGVSPWHGTKYMTNPNAPYTGKMFSGGGFAGERIPIVAHAGEWVVNKMQQAKIASRIGMSIERLKETLGFSGGPISFAGGGVAGDFSANVASATYPSDSKSGGSQSKQSYKDAKDTLVLVRDLYRGLLGGKNDTEFTAPQILTDSPARYFKAIALFATAQHNTMRQIDDISAKLEQAQKNNDQKKIKEYTKKLNDSFDLFFKNLNQMIGDNGIFALAAQAIADFSSSQQSMVALAASGVRMLGQRLKFGAVPTAIRQAERDLQSTIREIPKLEKLQRDEVVALAETNKHIAHLQSLGKLDKDQVALLQKLVGARADIIKKLRDLDSSLASSLQNRFDKQVALFQARTDQSLRHATTLSGQGAIFNVGNIPGIFGGLSKTLGRVGPSIGAGLAQMAQTIAQTLGNPADLARADQAVLSTAQATTRDLRKRYEAAAKKAQHDPRWQKVADDLLQQLEGSIQGVVQAQAQALSDRISAQDVKGQKQQSFVDLLNRVLTVRGSLGDQLGAAAGQISVSRANAAGLGGQLAAYQGLFRQAQAEGNVGAMDTLAQKITDLTAQIAEANLQTQQLITAYHQVSVTMLQTTQSASSGFFSAANSIAQTLGAIAGNQNLPTLIQYAKEAGQTLVSQAGSIVQTVKDTVYDPNAPFGQFQGQAGDLLNQLSSAFQQGPQVFANSLAQMSPGIANFEAHLPPDEQTLFQNLVQAMIDNTTSQVDNTQQLQQLNATTNQQQFTSSAWTLFRQAIFNGLGGLLPQYAMAVPSMDVGGAITNSGLLYGHKGEVVLPADVVKGKQINGGNENHFHIDHPMEVADPVYLGNAIAWRLNNDPNSR